MPTNTKEYIIGEISKVFIPLHQALSDSTSFKLFMSKLGYDIDIIPQPISNISNDVDEFIIIISPIIDGSATSSDYLSALTALVNLFSDIQGLENADFSDYPQLGNDFNSIFPKQLIDYLIVSYFQTNHEVFSAVVQLLGIFKITYIVPDISSPKIPYNAREINWDKIITVIQKPTTILNEIYYWGSNDNELGMQLLLSGVTTLFESLGTLFKMARVDYQLARKLEEDNSIPADSSRYSLDMLFYLKVLTNGYLSSGIGIYPLPPSVNRLPGIALLPYANDNFNLKTLLFDSLYLKIASTVNLPAGAAVIFRANESIKIITDLNGVTGGVNEGDLKLSLINEDSSGNPILLFGKEDGTFLKYQTLSFSTGFHLRLPNIEELYIELKFEGGQINISADSGDGFINKIIPSGGVHSNIDLLIGFSSLRGFYFNGDGGIQIKIPNHVHVGPIELSSIIIDAVPQNDILPISLSADINLKLGPISLSISSLGINGIFSFPVSGGNIGPIDFDLGFKPPLGVGLAIDASPVSGGGFLNYDEATYTYTGGLELNFSKISFSAIGIISTKLPGGEDGYSLLIIITAEFGPLPIGMGFTLNGLGGLMGLNRTMNPEFLREGIKNNTLDSILFPKDIVKNANTIISNIGQAFPILKDQFVIGPMAKIGWGTPTLITIELGIMIELPNPVRLAILGVLKAILPTESKPVLQLQVNFLGIIDFDNKYISFDASLYDSKVLTFGLFGDMALRLYWGDEPNFLLSVGGFHPKFTPPPLDLPTMRRLSIVLANESNLKISVETYFAVTSNSVQFGAKVAAMAKAWKIQAIGALWFDILFQFSPFHFIADMGAMFAIKMGSKTILSLFIDLSLEGPHPWKAQGRGSFKILFVKVNVSFNKTFGSANVATIPPVAIDDKFTDAVKGKDNWEAILADRNNQQVACREIAGYQQDLLIVDPGGSLRFSQNLVPLDTKIEKFGNSAISDYNKYSIAAANHGFTLSPAQDYFARNSFFYLSDDDKLSRPSYELFNSGIIAGATAIVSRFAVHRLCEYEQITLDSGYRELKPVWAMLETLFDVHVFENYVSRAQIAQFDKIPTEKGWPGTVQLSHDDDDFVLVNRNNLEQAIPQSFSSSVEAERVLQENRNTQPGVASEWIVANRFELEL